jgi:hypothetical protein
MHIGTTNSLSLQDSLFFAKIYTISNKERRTEELKNFKMRSGVAMI